MPFGKQNQFSIMRKNDKDQSTPPKLLKSNGDRKAKMPLFQFWNKNLPLKYFFASMIFFLKNKDFGKKIIKCDKLWQNSRPVCYFNIRN